MSFDTHKNWFYELYGRYIHLWQWVESAATDTLGSYRVKLPSEYYGRQLIYPDEDITNGLRVEYTALYNPFITEAIETTTARASGTGIAFVDGGGSSDTITDSNSGFGDFADGDRIRVIGSGSNDGEYTLSGSASAGTLTVATGTFTAETASESITIYQVPKAVIDANVSESTHLNLNRLLSLATVDYVKAQMALEKGDAQMKEYYMREFYKKIADDQSNKRRISISFPIGNFAVR
tara:strand:+ start:3092 stop:3799 length:708 start_codon:yes stop_codon:yes gene_type:complete